MVEGGGGGTTSLLECSSPAAVGRRYGVREAEVALHKALSVIRVEIILLDDSPHVFEIQKRAKGQALLDLVFNHLELLEREYFGLQYRDTSAPPGETNKRWLDPLKTVKKQLKLHSRSIDTCELPVLEFRVKFWVTDPGRLTEEYTRYHVVLQLRRLIANHCLPAPPTTAALLASYALQSDFGDYNPAEHGTQYLADAVLLPPLPPNMVCKVIELHKLHKGQTPADAEYQFLDHAKRLELYGVDIHKALDSSERSIDVGVTSSGLVVIHNGVKMNTFSWAKIIKISFKRRQFMIHLRREMCMASGEESVPQEIKRQSVVQILKKRLCSQSESYESVLVFTLPSYRACKCLWKSCVEHHTFFRLHTPRPPPKRQFALGSKFWYSGRTQYQALEEARKTASPSLRTFVRSPSKQASLGTLGTNGTTATSSTSHTKRSHTSPAVGTANIMRPRSDSGYRVTSLPTTPKMAWAEHHSISNGSGKEAASIDSDDAALRPSSHLLPSSALSVLSSTEGGDPSSSAAPSTEAFAPLATHDVVLSSSSSSSASSISSRTEEASECNILQPVTSEESEHGLITIRITPDTAGKFAGKFGFNVKGGADQETPVLVSKVTAGSPADTCYPRLNEGDQVLLINGREVSSMTHEQVVNSIKASKECHSGELVLTVKQNVYEGEGSEEPPFRFVPESKELQGSLVSPPSNDASSNATSPHQLKESMSLLRSGLQSGDLISRFEIAYRRKPGLMMDIARLPRNENRNRYRDISPYDTTRVILGNLTNDSNHNDYINASHVKMKIPGSNITNSYIASQGPLSFTSPHFWQMVWEQNSILLVMLTTVIEQGRTKCHQYWPENNGTAEYGYFKVTCKSQELTAGGAFREFILVNKLTSEERRVIHMQYLSWPDHGVPEHSTDFLTFVKKVREIRSEEDSTQATIVHCSAGIGRTGVLILMETAQCLIEANQPVYPLSLVEQMRDQRAMMIQTSGQFRFVCEAIDRVYSEKLVHPLPQYTSGR